uniref:Uncharacterized protein n=1 Tax=Podoviridae sp. ctuQh21 TaxID=2825284 RepID=A0A8S5PG06_9CAUD|nr:MAG TPA: hypothetical protein [Podoviridae sp. ctuQh21]
MLYQHVVYTKKIFLQVKKYKIVKHSSKAYLKTKNKKVTL